MQLFDIITAALLGFHSFSIRHIRSLRKRLFKGRYLTLHLINGSIRSLQCILLGTQLFFISGSRGACSYKFLGRSRRVLALDPELLLVPGDLILKDTDRLHTLVKLRLG